MVTVHASRSESLVRERLVEAIREVIHSMLRVGTPADLGCTVL